MDIGCARRPGVVMILIALAASGCDAAVDSDRISGTYDDAFAYCSAVGTADLPDDRYTGDPIPDEVIGGYLRAAGVESTTEPPERLRETTVWRCMDGAVYACNFGANLPCTAKADLDTSPSAAMNEFCAASRDAPSIPRSVTGRETIYDWGCDGHVPTVLQRIDEPDAAGFLSRIWYRVERGHQIEARPVGEIVFASDRDGGVDDLYLIDLTTGQTTRLTSGDTGSVPGTFSPDGRRLAYTGYGLVHSFIGIMDADGTNVQQLTQGDTDATFPSWSPDGTLIAFTSVRDGTNDIHVVAPDGSGLSQLTDGPADDVGPTWSPDGRRIAFVSDRGADAGHTSLYVMAADGSDVVRLTFGPAIDHSPAWSPDGTLIAFRSHHDGPGDIYVISPDGSGLRRVTHSPADDWAPAWSPDGRWLAFQSRRDGDWEIYVASVDGGSAFNVTGHPADDQAPQWRP